MPPPNALALLTGEDRNVRKSPASFCFLALTASLVATSAWSAIVIDATVAKDQSKKSTSVTTASFSTTSGNELLLAFVAADAASGANTTVTAISGAGLQWSLVQRTNAQRGTAEIWRAFSSN